MFYKSFKKLYTNPKQSTATCLPQNSIFQFFFFLLNRLVSLAHTMPLFFVMMLGLYSENGWGQLAQFSFPASNSLVVSSNAANITVGNISLSSGTIETNITTGTYFPNEPYIEETGGWTSNTQSSAKSFDFTISADNGYVFSITNIYFRAYSTSAGPSAFGFRIGSTDIYSVNAPSASILVVDQAVSNQTSLSTATIKIQGWLNGSRTSNGSGVFRLDDIIITGTVTAASTAPAAPTITSITPGNQQLSVAFTAGSDGGSAITNYKYSTDGGTSWQTRSTGTTTSPLVISTLSIDGTTPLTNGTSYDVQIRAVNTVGDGTATSSTAATPRTTPSAPTITSITPGNQQLSVTFTAGSDGGSAITTYKYSTDGGLNWQTRASGTTASPLVISTLSTDGTTALTNGTSYNVQIRAVNTVGDGTATASTAATPRTTPSAPTITSITSGNQQLSVAFTAGSDGGSAITTYKYSTDGGLNWQTRASGTTASPLLISTLSTDGTTALTNGVSYDIQIRAVNAAGDGTATATTQGTPAAPSSPTITGAATAIAFTTTYGTVSASQSFSVSGAALTADITATAPTGFEVSSDNSTYGSTATFTQSGGSASGTLYIRLAATATVSGSYNSQNIALTSTGASTVNIITSSSGNTVTAKGLTITGISISNKTYDGNTTATISGTAAYSGLVNSESFSVTGTPSATFSDKNVANGKSVSVSDYTAPSANYSITQPTGLTANITAKTLTVTSAAVTSKSYDGTNTATITGSLSGVVSGDVVTLNGTGTFASVNVGTGINVTSTSTLSGADAGNYSLTQPTGLTGDITGASQTITFNALTPVTTSTADYSPGATASSGLTVSYSSSNTCVATIVGGNIHIVGAGTTTITASQSGNGTYAAATSVNQTLTVNQICGSEDFTNCSATSSYSNSNFTGSNNVIWSYVESRDESTYGINGKGIMLRGKSATYSSKIASSSIFGGIGSFNCSLKKAFTGSGLRQVELFINNVSQGTCNAWDNNTIQTFTINDINISGNIVIELKATTDKQFIIDDISWTCYNGPSILTSGTLSAVNTTYGTASATPTSFSVSANQLTTNLTISAPSGFEISTSIGSGYNTTLTITPDACGTISTTTIYVRLAATTVPGNYSGNILMSSTGAINVNVATVSSTISVKPLTITGLSADNKIYDGLTTATTSGTASLLGIIGSDNVTLSGTPIFTFSTATVGTGKTVSTSGYTLSGSQASYYSLTQPSFTANISAKELTISSAAANNKTYDGTTTAIITGTLSGVISPDVVTLNLSGTFTSANAGTGISVTSTSSLSGANSGNYTLTQLTGLVADINLKSLIITANDVSKPPGLLLTGGSGSTAFTTTGLIGSETIGTVIIAYGSAGATTGDGNTNGVYTNQVTPSSATGGTFSISNYSISYVAGTINVVGEYQTRQSGNWGTLSTWEKWNGSSWVACTNSNEIPDYSTVNVTIKNGHIIDNDGTGGGGPWDVNNLIVETGGKLWDNQFGGLNSYLQIYGNITCDGTIGDSNGDDISFDIVGGNNCTISGNGTFTATRIRKDANINSTTDATLTINMDIRLTWSSASGAVIYNDGTESNFNVIVNNGKTVRGSGPGSSLANVSIDGNNNTSPDNSNSGGTLTVNGTLDIDGVLYSYTNNTTAGRSCNIIINNGGIIKCRYIKTGVSGSSGNLLRIMSGGKLNIFGSVDTITATLNDITWNNFSTTNNTWDFQDGSTIEYSSATQQQINGITSCSNFIVSGGGLKKLGNDFAVSKMLTLTNGKIQTDSYKLIHTSTLSTDLSHSSGSSSFINGNYRRYITSNTDSYELPVGLSNSTTDYHPANFLNGNLDGLNYLDVSVNSVLETDNNVDQNLNTLQQQVAVTDVDNTAEWNITPNSTPTSGNYGVDLYVTNMNISSSDDNKFVVVKRPDNSTDYADWNTFESTTFIPVLSEPGRIYNSGNGFARRTNYTSFSKFAIGKLNNTVLPIDVYDFKVSKQLENNLVEWKSSDEENLLHYELEKSKDGINYYFLDKVNPIESNYFNEKQYSYVDTLSADLTTYYKLYSRDINGKRNYHGLAFSFNEKIEEGISINYQSTKINIEVANPENINEINLYGALGQLIKKINKKEINNNLITIEFSEFNYGIYLLNINSKYKSVNKKLIIGSN